MIEALAKRCRGMMDAGQGDADRNRPGADTTVAGICRNSVIVEELNIAVDQTDRQSVRRFAGTADR
ncbi:hypothetical protein [Loktanella fryxellensis]|uniref:hypothetical protein n=1 Tax=Loktanella fryxellensis TaxID=245187 RepID=UPI000B7EAD82|nr:hypothetical protein [Loktanella fryxellensis]